MATDLRVVHIKSFPNESNPSPILMEYVFDVHPIQLIGRVFLHSSNYNTTAPSVSIWSPPVPGPGVVEVG